MPQVVLEDHPEVLLSIGHLSSPQQGNICSDHSPGGSFLWPGSDHSPLSGFPLLVCVQVLDRKGDFMERLLWAGSEFLTGLFVLFVTFCTAQVPQESLHVLLKFPRSFPNPSPVPAALVLR